MACGLYPAADLCEDLCVIQVSSPLHLVSLLAAVSLSFETGDLWNAADPGEKLLL